MKHVNRSHLAIVPLLSVLTMSPFMMEKHFHGTRSIASVEMCSKDHPKYDVLVSKVDTKTLMKNEDVDFEKFKSKRDEIQDKIVTARLQYEANFYNADSVKEERKDVEDLVSQLAVVDATFQALKDKNSVQKEDQDASAKVVEDSKKVLEDLIDNLESKEERIASREEKKEDPQVSQGKKDEDKKEEKKEEKKEDKPVVADKDDKKKDEDCKDDRTKVLSDKVDKLVEQQNQILQNLLLMSQTMLMSMQQQLQGQQQNFYTSMNANRTNQSPYQYNSPYSAGNWVYYPQGYQPQSQNIFQGQGSMQTQGYYPSSVYQNSAPQSNWMMAPSYSFPQTLQPQQYVPGSFGSPYSFNMGGTMQNISQGLASVR